MAHEEPRQRLHSIGSAKHSSELTPCVRTWNELLWPSLVNATARLVLSDHGPPEVTSAHWTVARGAVALNAVLVRSHTVTSTARPAGKVVVIVARSCLCLLGAETEQREGRSYRSNLPSGSEEPSPTPPLRGRTGSASVCWRRLEDCVSWQIVELAFQSDSPGLDQVKHLPRGVAPTGIKHENPLVLTAIPCSHGDTEEGTRKCR